MSRPSRRRIVSTGVQVRVDPLDRIPAYDPRSGEHLWIVTGAWKVNPEQWHSPDPNVTPLLDSENLLSVAGPGCYWCEAYYSPTLATRRCPGEPR
jgi:hypothetical protein